eukprot:gene24810-biopygen17947
MQDIIPDAVQEWHAEDVIFEAFWRIFSAFWTTKLAKNGLKDALQRRGYLRSLPMGPIDGRKKPFRMRSAPESRQGYPPFSLTVEIRYMMCTVLALFVLEPGVGKHTKYTDDMTLGADVEGLTVGATVALQTHKSTSNHPKHNEGTCTDCTALHRTVRICCILEWLRMRPGHVRDVSVSSNLSCGRRPRRVWDAPAEPVPAEQNIVEPTIRMERDYTERNRADRPPRRRRGKASQATPAIGQARWRWNPAAAWPVPGNISHGGDKGHVPDNVIGTTVVGDHVAPVTVGASVACALKHSAQ